MLAMPAQDRVRCHEGRDLREHSATKVSQFREAPPFAVVETQALPRQPSLQHAVLLAQERDHVGLLGLEPAAQRGDQQLEREHGPSLRPLPLIHLWDTTGKNREPDAVLGLSDARGRERLRLIVTAQGAARIEFLDESGHRTMTMPGQK
jgi:hypothetical protein